jgi:hypothetical protein
MIEYDGSSLPCMHMVGVECTPFLQGGHAMYPCVCLWWWLQFKLICIFVLPPPSVCKKKKKFKVGAQGEKNQTSSKKNNHDSNIWKSPMHCE